MKNYICYDCCVTLSRDPCVVTVPDDIMPVFCLCQLSACGWREEYNPIRPLTIEGPTFMRSTQADREKAGTLTTLERLEKAIHEQAAGATVASIEQRLKEIQIRLDKAGL